MKPFKELNPDRLQRVGTPATDANPELPGASVPIQQQNGDDVRWLLAATAICRDTPYLDSSIDDEDAHSDGKEWLSEEEDGEEYMDAIIFDEEDTDEEDDWDNWDMVEGGAEGDGDLPDDLHPLLNE